MALHCVGNETSTVENAPDIFEMDYQTPNFIKISSDIIDK